MKDYSSRLRVLSVSSRGPEPRLEVRLGAFDRRATAYRGQETWEIEWTQKRAYGGTETIVRAATQHECRVFELASK